MPKEAAFLSNPIKTRHFLISLANRREVEVRLSLVSASLQEDLRRAQEEAVWYIAGEPRACAAIPGDDLISDEQDLCVSRTA